jgi:hypothetical protein
MSISNYLEEAWLKTLRGGGSGTNFTAPAAVYVKLHTGDPGEDGTANAAAETTRQAATFAAPANPGGTMDSSADVTWTSVSTTETYRYISLWDNSTAGNCLMSGALTADRSVTAGDTFTLASGRLQLVLA